MSKNMFCFSVHGQPKIINAVRRFWCGGRVLTQLRVASSPVFLFFWRDRSKKITAALSKRSIDNFWIVDNAMVGGGFMAKEHGAKLEAATGYSKNGLPYLRMGSGQRITVIFA